MPDQAPSTVPVTPLTPRGPLGSLRAPGGFGARFVAVLSGEMLQSLFHLVLNVVLVRELAAREYGLFAIVFTVGAVGVTYIRALVAVPANLHLAASRGRPAARGYGVMFGSGAALVAGLMAAAVALGLAPMLGSGAAAAGAFVGAYAFRSYLRIALLAAGHAGSAALGDAVYAGCGLLFLGAEIFRGGTGEGLLGHAFLAVAAAHAIGILVAYRAARLPLRLALHPRARARYRTIWRTLAWSLAGVTGLTVQGQGLTLLFALLAGPAAYAPVAATLVLYAPLRIPANALMNLALPEIGRLRAAGDAAGVGRLVRRCMAALATGCLAYGAVLALALPMIETVLFKGRFAGEPMGWIGLGVWCVTAVCLLYAIPRAYLEAAADFSAITRIAVASAGLGFALMVPLLLLLPPASALAGLLASELATLAGSLRAMRRRARVPTG